MNIAFQKNKNFIYVFITFFAIFLFTNAYIFGLSMLQSSLSSKLLKNIDIEKIECVTTNINVYSQSSNATSYYEEDNIFLCNIFYGDDYKDLEHPIDKYLYNQLKDKKSTQINKVTYFNKKLNKKSYFLSFNDDFNDISNEYVYHDLSRMIKR